MERYNSFRIIHKALRAMLYDAALTLQQTDFADISQSGSTFEEVESVLYLFEQHIHHEENTILSAIADFEPQLVEAFEKEHVTDIVLGDRLRKLIKMFRNTDIAEGRIICGSAITKSFGEFMVFNLGHMSKEEVVINQALWEYYSDEQLLALNEQLVASIPAADRALSVKWMLRGINDAEAITWLKGIKKSAPGVVFESFWNRVEAELPESRLENIGEAVLGPGIPVWS